MSMPKIAEPLFTGQLRTRLPTGNWPYDTSELFVLCHSEWRLNRPSGRKFTIQNAEAQIPPTQKFEDPEPEKMPLSRESAYVHNCTSSSFHKLPLELTLAVAQHLSPVARLAMQRVCSKFRAALAPCGVAPELESNVVTVKEIFQFAFLLRRDVQLRLQDDYDRRCDLAPPNSALHDFGCSGCRTTHEMESFSANQLSSSPKTRICKGLQGSFRLCNHLSFSAECLLRGLRELKNAEVFCQASHHLDIYGKSVLALGGSQTGPRVGFHGGHTITMDRSVPVLQTDENEKATHDQLSFALRKQNAYICPHLNSSSPELFDGKPITADCPNYVPTGVEHDRYEFPCFCAPQRQLRLGECVTWSRCPARNCFTRYCLSRKFDGGHGIVLEVSRDLFGCPTNPAWRAQMVQKKAKTKAEDGSIKMSKSSTPIGARTGSSQNVMTRCKTKAIKCSACFTKCGRDCVMERYIPFMNS